MLHKKASLLKLIYNEDTEPSECLRAIWPFLQISRFLGLFPILRQENHLVAPSTIWSVLWIPTIIALILQFLILSKVVYYNILHILNGVFKVRESNDFTFYGQIFSFYIFMIYRIKDIPEFLAACRKVEMIFRKYQVKDDKLGRDAILLFNLFFWSQNLENLFYYYSWGKLKFNKTTNCI